MADWDEIRKLAADLQRAQLSGSVQKLSERNCIEIVTKLVESGLLNIIFTSDGKEYVTPKHLQREISDELYSAGGRIGLAELSQILTIDFSHIEAQSEELSRTDQDVNLVLGQLVHNSYLDRIAQEINEKLQLAGIATLAEFTKEYNLPSEFLFEHLINKRLGSVIEGFQDESDPKVILTTTYVNRNRARIRGALSGITSPTSMATVATRFGFDGRMFMNLTEQLIQEGKLQGTITGGKQLNKATYVPNAYARAQARWVDDFLAQNGYLEYDALRRLGISDPESTVRRRCKDEEIVFLNSCCLAQSVVDQVISAIDVAAVAADAWVDVAPILPSVLSSGDVSALLHQLMATATKKKSGQWSNTKIYCDSIVASKLMVSKLREPFKEKMNEKATKVVQNGSYAAAIKLIGHTEEKRDYHQQDQQDKKEERRKKAASGKAGGGAQGRETKTKSTKKKAVGNRRKGGQDSDDDDVDSGDERGGHDTGKKKKPEALQFMTVAELQDHLRLISVLQDAPDDFIEALADQLYPELSREYEEVAAQLFQTAVTSSMQGKKKNLAEFQEKTNALVDTIRLFEKGVSSFEGSDRTLLEKHLIKTMCTEIMMELLRYVCQEHQVDIDASKELNADQRLKVFGQLPRDVADPMMPIHKSLVENSASNFLSALESNLSNICGVMVRKADKKKDRQLLFNHRHSMVDQMENSQDPAVVLHLAALVIFQAQTGNMLHASGKFVPSIISFISSGISEEQKEVLTSYQADVIRHLSLEAGDEKDGLQRRLEERVGAVKEVAKACDSKRSK